MNYPSFTYDPEDIKKFKDLNVYNVTSFMDIVVMIKYIFNNRYDYVVKNTPEGGSYHTNVEPLYIEKDGKYDIISIQASPNHYCTPKGLHPEYKRYEVNKPSFLLSDTFTAKYQLYKGSYVNVKLEDIAKEIYNYIHDINYDKSEDSVFVHDFYERIMNDGVSVLLELNSFHEDGIVKFSDNMLSIQATVNDYIDECNEKIRKGLEYKKSKVINLYKKSIDGEDIIIMLYHQYTFGKNIDEVVIFVSEYMVDHIGLEEYYDYTGVVHYYKAVPLDEAMDAIYYGMMSLRDELLIKFGEI